MFGRSPAYNRDNVPYFILASYALPFVPLNAIIVAIFFYVPTFYAQEMGVGLGLIGALIFVSRMFDAVSDPLIGVLSDKTRSRFGRRKPWIAAGALIASVSCFFLFSPPANAGAAHMIFWLILTYLGWTMVNIPHIAWGTELTRNYHQRTRVMAFRDGADVFGFMLLGLVPIVFAIEGEGFSGDVLAILALPAALLLILTVVPALLFLPKGYSQQESPAVRLDKKIITDFVDNKPYVRLCIAMACARIGDGIRGTLAVIFVTYYWERTDFLTIFLFVFTAGNLVSIPFWVWISKRMEKAVAMRMSIALGFLMSPGYLLADPQSTVMISAVVFMIGVSAVGNSLLPNTMLGDVIDLDTLRSRKLRAGAYVSVWSFLIKLTHAAPVIIIFPAIGAAGFDVTLGAENSDRAVLTVGLIFALTPMVFQAGAAWAIWNFPLTRARHAVVRRRIEGVGPGVA